jgi:hypothetical protein
MRSGPIDPGQRSAIPGEPTGIGAGEQATPVTGDKPKFSVGMPRRNDAIDAGNVSNRSTSMFRIIRNVRTPDGDTRTALSLAFRKLFQINGHTLTNAGNLDALAEAVMDDPVLGQLIHRLLPPSAGPMSGVQGPISRQNGTPGEE